jgi:peptide deformylase
MSDIYKIETGVNNPILREIAVDVKEIDEDLLAFSENLISYMYDNDGVGLAAPQL